MVILAYRGQPCPLPSVTVPETVWVGSFTRDRSAVLVSFSATVIAGRLFSR
jgi:hypothetical protein